MSSSSVFESSLLSKYSRVLTYVKLKVLNCTFNIQLNDQQERMVFSLVCTLDFISLEIKCIISSKN